jgi:hypothetical protein
LFKVNSIDCVILRTVVVVSIASVIVSGTANAQNSSSINSNGFPTNGTAKNATANGTAKNATATSLTNFNRTGFANVYVLTSPTGKTFPIKYTINGGKLVGMLADKERTTLVLVLDPGQNGGNLTIELPRNIVDSKGASNSDTNYQIKIDGKGVDYKELANNMNARILSIGFSKDNRFMEISGTQMTS